MLDPTKVPVLTDHGLVQVDPEAYAMLGRLWGALHSLTGEQLKTVMKAAHDAEMAEKRSRLVGSIYNKRSLPA